MSVLNPQKNNPCPVCAHDDSTMIFSLKSVPVQSVQLVKNLTDSLEFPRGTIDLFQCSNCGFGFNAAFDPKELDYSKDYEETQGFSKTFNTFQKELAANLVMRFELNEKHILEIGCGKGDFLAELCRQGNNHGTGFDPAFDPNRNPANDLPDVIFHQRNFSGESLSVPPDFIACKMTLEHIHDPVPFLSMIRRAITLNSTRIFIQVPSFDHIMEENSFWDVYYEHCNYFSESALRYAMTRAGFDVIDCWSNYEDQYLFLIGSPGNLTAKTIPANGSPIFLLQDQLSKSALKIANYVRKNFDEDDVVLWGGGSKAVAFLTATGLEDMIHNAVDINPYRQGTYLPGLTTQIISPEELSNKTKLILVMNPIYLQEIKKLCVTLGNDTNFGWLAKDWIEELTAGDK